ncbi:uncharacterized protein At4g04775-like [Gastrolobium bilobum]|uniref:uncharacterized protein At4g04775-like n=1 Tax=Gastrolobium bilobum TaxID=150636 RepID=UPI002AB29FF8|nr:uncharacterized protein At4g04775-like [Gastrolobium bilobum]
MNISSGRGSSSSSFGSRSGRRRAAPLCKCGRHNVVYTSKTPRNPNRSFFGCPNFKEKKPHCKFFTWVDDATSDTMELEDWTINKLELNIAEMEFKLNFLDMKLNEELQLEVNDHKKKINEHCIKIEDISMKMQADFEKVEKEMMQVCRCARVFAGSIIVVFLVCIYLASRLE